MKRLLLPALLLFSSPLAAAPASAESTLRPLPAECNKLEPMAEPADPKLKCKALRASFASSCRATAGAVVVTNGVMACATQAPEGRAGAAVTPPADTGCVLRPGAPPCTK